MTKKLKVIFVVTEGWFFLSHFRPLAEAISDDGNYEGAIITTVGDTGSALQKLGLKILPLNFERSSFNVFSALKLLLNLISVLRKERADIVHFIALKTIVLGGVASLFLPKTAKVYHLTGLGYLVDGKTWLTKLRQKIVFYLVAFFTNRRKAWLITENPDDLAFLQSYGATKTHTSLFGGAGVNPEYFIPLPPPQTEPVRIAYVGRMIWSKGVDVLVEAATRLQKNGTNIQLDLFGTPDLANPNTISIKTLEAWNRLPNVIWHGATTDVREVWAKCEIAIMPTRTREGMPRSMLEAAACARALIASDVPGCRHFVKNLDTGLLVPPENSDKLAQAIKTLVLDPQLRLSLGQAARKSILEKYTEAHVRKALLEVYHQFKLTRQALKTP